ncbi:MAG: Enoyl-CoA hydratase/isomerase [Myxococcaceae bacterium]|nr:Enoyl-CoA hydratase/isomerase [Myxococcaceae bacterium]
MGNVERLDEGAAQVLRINRPDRKNALDPETFAELRAHADALRSVPGVRGVIITGEAAGGVFVSGGDLKALKDVRTARGAREMARKAHATLDALRELGVPLVAAVAGDALGGGCELAAACDYRVAEAQVRFHWVQARYGVTTGWGGAANLLELVPRGTAMRWLLTTDPVGADEAHAAGFVDAVVKQGEALDHARDFVQRVARQPKAGLRRMVFLLRETARLDARRARVLELDHFGRSWATTDHHDAVARFLRKG